MLNEKAQRNIVDKSVADAKASPEPPEANLTLNMNQITDNVIVRGVDSQKFHAII